MPGTLPARATRRPAPLDPAVVRAQAAEISARLPRDPPEVVAARQAVLYRDTVLPGQIPHPRDVHRSPAGPVRAALAPQHQGGVMRLLSTTQAPNGPAPTKGSADG